MSFDRARNFIRIARIKIQVDSIAKSVDWKKRGNQFHWKHGWLIEFGWLMNDWMNGRSLCSNWKSHNRCVIRLHPRLSHQTDTYYVHNIKSVIPSTARIPHASRTAHHSPHRAITTQRLSAFERFRDSCCRRFWNVNKLLLMIRLLAYSHRRLASLFVCSHICIGS